MSMLDFRRALLGMGVSAMTAGVLAAALPGSAAAQTAPDCSIGLVNGGFEAPDPGPGVTMLQAANSPSPVAGIGWSSTDDYGVVELWNEYRQYEGSYFAELNANSNSTLFQDLPTEPGTVLRWRVAHAGRDGVDTMHVGLGAPEGMPGPGESVSGLTPQVPDGATTPDISDDRNGEHWVEPDGWVEVNNWRQWTGTYTVPAGQTSTRFGLIAVSTASGDLTVGNFIDAVSLTTEICDEIAHPAPTAEPLTSTGLINATQSVTLAVPSGGTASLLDWGNAPATALVRSEGTYDYDSATGVVTFTPATGFYGTPPAVGYRLTNTYASADSTYVPTVELPPAPAPGDQTSTGPMNTTQWSEGAPSALFRHAADSQSNKFFVAGQGLYETDRGDGTEFSFTPVDCYMGTADPVTFVITDEHSQMGEATYTATVTDPVAPVADPVTTSGLGTEQQVAVITPPVCGGTIQLLDADGTPTSTLSRPGEGSYSVVPATGVLTFDPTFGYSGTPAAVGYRFTDMVGNTVDSTYTPTVTAPARPAPIALTSTGEGTATQVVGLMTPQGGTAALLDSAANATNSLVVAGVGTYVLDPTTNIVSFAPVAAFSGTAGAVTYQITDAYGQAGTSTYTARVTTPDGPLAPALTSTGSAGAAQQQQVPIPIGGQARLLATGGQAVTSVTVAGVGTYVLDVTTGVITFTPVKGFSGWTSGVAYRVTDAYGQSATGSYAARVAASVSTVVLGTPSVTAPRIVVHYNTIPATCRLTAGRVAGCTVTAYATVSGRRTPIGSGRTTAPTAAGVISAVVQVRLTALGRALAARPNGVAVALQAAVRQAGTTSTRYAATATRVVAPRVQLRTLYFSTDSSSLRASDAAYLTRIRARLANVRGVTCTGYADARSTSSYNMALGRRRAVAACNHLLRGTVIPRTIVTRGETRPAAPNGTVAGRALNRRVEITLRY